MIPLKTRVTKGKTKAEVGVLTLNVLMTLAAKKRGEIR